MAADDLLWMRNFLQDDLYLVETDKKSLIPASTDIEETTEIAFNCLGDQNTGFLILVNYPDEQHIQPGHLKSLENILGRKNIAIKEVTVFNTAKNSKANYQEINDHFKPKKILVMGADALPDGLKTIDLNIIEERDGFRLLYTHSFAEMATEDKKRVFWNQVKNF